MGTLSTPANLIETLEPDSSAVYVRRVTARILGHAIADGLTWTEARILWETLGYDPGRWGDYASSVRLASMTT